MLIDKPDAFDTWRQRYERTRDAFQAKHEYVTRLEIRVDDLEAETKTLKRRLDAADKAQADIVERLVVLEKAKAVVRRKPKAKAK